MIRFYLIFTLLTFSAVAQTKTVNKTISNNALTENLVLPTGRTITINSGASIINNGTATGFGSGDWASITGKPTTLSGFGITDGQPLDADLTAIAALTTTTIGRSLLAGADAAALRTILALGTASTATLATAITSGHVPTIHNATGTADRAMTGYSSTGRIQFAIPTGSGAVPVWQTSPTFFGNPKIGAGTTGATSLEFYDSVTGGDNFIALRAPGNVSNDVTFILPGADGTNGQALVTNGSGTLSFATVGAGGATLSANTFTGLQQFSGTDHAGLRLNNLTTAQRDAIASPAAGMAIWNTTANRLQLHNGSGWTAGMVRIDGDTMTGALTITQAAALSTSGLKLDGTWSTAGTTTTDKPSLLIEPAGSTSTAWSTNGTGLGVNAATGFTGNLIDAQLNGSARFSVSSAGAVTSASSGTFSNISTAYLTGVNRIDSFGSGVSIFDNNWNTPWGLTMGGSGVVAWGSTATTAGSLDTYIGRQSAAVVQMGLDTSTNGATAVGQTFKGPDATGTTSTGGSLTIEGGTGTSSGGAVIIRTSATTTPAARMTIKASGVINVSGIPTSSAGLVTGDLWSDGGTIKVIP